MIMRQSQIGALVLVALLAGAAAPASACVPDFNADGLVNRDDVTSFVKAWHLAPIADFNRSGAIAIDDFYAFETAWFAKTCPSDVNRDNLVYPNLDDFYDFTYDIWLPLLGDNMDCNGDLQYTELDVTQFMATWCAVAGC